jgi:predicted phosphoribosyltransferase
MQFRDRVQAGRELAGRLAHYAGRDDVVVLALPRGGVPVGYEVAVALGAPLDVFLVRKLGVPGHEELAMGAIASNGVRVINDRVVGSFGIPEEVIDEVEAVERQELQRRELEYRDNRPPPDLRDKTVILVDDGLATGSTMRAAVAAVLHLRPAHIVVAVPVGASDACESFGSEVDEVICIIEPEPFYGVGMWYEDFSQTTDEQVRALLNQSEAPRAR